MVKTFRMSPFSPTRLHITGPPTPVFLSASTRGSMVHPLFFSAPRGFPITSFHLAPVILENIHLPHPTVLFNLLQDCLQLSRWQIHCSNLTWDHDSPTSTTLPTVGLKFACRTSNFYWVEVSGCTDNVLVAAMMQSVPHHELSQKRQGPHLSLTDTHCLLDIMRATWAPSSKNESRPKFYITATTDFDIIQSSIETRLPPGTDFRLEWRAKEFFFASIACHSPGEPSDIRHVTCIIVDLRSFNNSSELREGMKATNIYWNSFFHAARRFPGMCRIAIKYTRTGAFSSVIECREMLAEFVAHLEELGRLGREVEDILELHAGLWDEETEEYGWAGIKFDKVLHEVRRKRQLEQAEKESSGEFTTNDQVE